MGLDIPGLPPPPHSLQNPPKALAFMKGSSLKKYDLDELIGQLDECVDATDGKVVFMFQGEEFSFTPDYRLSDADQKKFQEVSGEDFVATAHLLMGKKEYERFVKTGGNGLMFHLLMLKTSEKVRKFSFVDPS